MYLSTIALGIPVHFWLPVHTPFSTKPPVHVIESMAIFTKAMLP